MADVNQDTQHETKQDTKQAAPTATGARVSRRKVEVGEVVSTKMAKTIVVVTIRKKAHPLYKRVVANKKKFYAHDENGTAHTGDVVRIEETRPLSKLKRWQLMEVIRKAPIVAGPVKAAAK